MQDYQRAFLDFLLEARALKVGEFKLKSGRLSPIYLNTGDLDTGTRLQHVGRAYAQTALTHLGKDGFDVIFGPAYKGIPLAVATVMALAEAGVDKAFLADRKEAKTHGAEAAGAVAAGRILGRAPKPGTRFVLVDDVLATGATKAEAVTFLRGLDPAAKFQALLIVLDREERTPDGQDAVGAFTASTGVPVLPVLRLTQTLDDLASRGLLGPHDLKRCRAYWAEHGTEAAQAWARSS